MVMLCDFLCQCNHSIAILQPVYSPFFHVPCHPSPVTPQPSTAAPFEVATVASLGAVAVSFTHVVKAAVCFFCKLNGGIVWESVRTIGNLGKNGKTMKNIGGTIGKHTICIYQCPFQWGQTRKNMINQRMEWAFPLNSQTHPQMSMGGHSCLGSNRFFSNSEIQKHHKPRS